jgi:hypothetical protein
LSAKLFKHTSITSRSSWLSFTGSKRGVAMLNSSRSVRMICGLHTENCGMVVGSFVQLQTALNGWCRD